MEQEKTANLREVVLKKDELITIIKENKEKHDAVFEAAIQGYWLKAEETLKAKRELFEKNISRIEEDFEKAFSRSDEAIQKKDKDSAKFYFNASVGIDNSWPLVYPENHSDDYAKALRMLELSIYDTVTLSEREFSAYVMNEWEWKKQFLVSNALYVDAYTGACFSGFAGVGAPIGTGVYSNGLLTSGTRFF